MDCVCGCGKKVPSGLATRNFLAASVALELLAWDKDRALPGEPPEGREGLIARGAECYQRLLYSIHGEGRDDSEEECRDWLKEAAAMRSRRPGMSRRLFLGTGPPQLSEADIARLDSRHPELSFTGEGEDFVEELERLRALRDDGVLTDDELAAAKARLLGRS